MPRYLVVTPLPPAPSLPSWTLAAAALDGPCAQVPSDDAATTCATFGPPWLPSLLPCPAQRVHGCVSPLTPADRSKLSCHTATLMLVMAIVGTAWRAQCLQQWFLRALCAYSFVVTRLPPVRRYLRIDDFTAARLVARYLVVTPLPPSPSPPL